MPNIQITADADSVPNIAGDLIELIAKSGYTVEVTAENVVAPFKGVIESYEIAVDDDALVGFIELHAAGARHSIDIDAITLIHIP